MATFDFRRDAPSSPSKRKRGKEVSFVSGNEEVYGELLEGGLEVWMLEKFEGQDGFTNDFEKSLNDRTFVLSHGVVRWAPRRV